MITLALFRDHFPYIVLYALFRVSIIRKSISMLTTISQVPNVTLSHTMPSTSTYLLQNMIKLILWGFKSDLMIFMLAATTLNICGTPLVHQNSFDSIVVDGGSYYHRVIMVSVKPLKVVIIRKWNNWVVLCIIEFDFSIIYDLITRRWLLWALLLAPSLVNPATMSSTTPMVLESGTNSFPLFGIFICRE